MTIESFAWQYLSVSICFAAETQLSKKGDCYKGSTRKPPDPTKANPDWQQKLHEVMLEITDAPETSTAAFSGG